MGNAEVYQGKYPNIIHRGIGLGQWTDTRDGSIRHTMLLNYAKDKGKKWYDLELQLDFMLNGDSPYYIEHLKNILHSSEDVDYLTNKFLVYWEGNEGDKVKERQHNAQQVLSYLKNPRGHTRGGSSVLESSWGFLQSIHLKYLVILQELPFRLVLMVTLILLASVPGTCIIG